ncbi:hypothetical protein AX14_010992 [Amanita brunnescens Koide BX004]|nr:hypothetical protein AX14_010992 [Amanita brunnescens Koide BX004]
MRAVTGPLQTGTYIVEPVSARGEFATLNKDQSKVALTKNHQSDAVKWSIEELGNDVYRVRVKGSNLTPIHNLEEQNVTMGEGAASWIIREMDVPGEYWLAL